MSKRSSNFVEEDLDVVVLFYNFADVMGEHENTYRSIVAYKDYFHDFIINQSKEVARKYNAVFRYICTQPRIPVKFFRSIQSAEGLFEIRVEMAGNIFRTFCCLDEGKIVVLFNSFQKKSQKTPTKEIDKAQAIMKEYFSTKD